MVVGFAGSGSMAAAVARGWARASLRPASMLFTDSGSGRATRLAAEAGGESLESIEDMADRADLVVLAVKPAALEEVAPRIAGRPRGVISVLGATPLSRLEPALAPTPVLRTMPNLAVEVGRGVICHTPLEEGDRAGVLGEALALLGSLGTIFEVAEDELDPATAVMGCAPAYIALAVEALIEAGVEAGLDDDLSTRLVSEATAGVGHHLLTHEPGPMRAAIASPGGSTEAGLAALAERDVHAAFKAAVDASLERMAETG
ncbi:MAG TPA: pyrroline-5-carboxylate reductase dimerization domain-containing protein [Solirubrobacterales bacterium]|nr:pyrroline-5-carboxylate reductase dimerization domain-containing protein [Solirubrobacterales bacterium]